MMVVGTEHEHPLFIPPRKRQTSKKTSGTQNYVDHIVVQGRNSKLSPTSPNVEESLLKTSLICKTSQQNLLDRQVDDSTSTKSSPLHTDSEFLVGTVTIKSSLQDCSNPPIDNGEYHPLHTFDAPIIQQQIVGQTNQTTPSYSESSLDAKSSMSRSQDCLTKSSKKRVNIRTDGFPQGILKCDGLKTNSPTSVHYDDLESGETSVLNATDLDQASLERYNRPETYLTMTGTVKRGRKKGQSVDLQLNISRDELERINEAALIAVEQTKKPDLLMCRCTLTSGMHIFLWSILCLPFVAIVTAMYSFYIGTITWYNMFNYFNEEKSCLYRFIMSPVLILAYPLGIVACTIGLGLYAGIVQLSVRLNSWLNEVADVEKGFYGWLCSILHLSDCSPYEVVILTELHMPERRDETVHGHSSTEELSL